MASPAFSQEPAAPPVESAATADLAHTADQKNTEWVTLAAALEMKIARMLPCDARVKSAIEEVSRASDVRFAAMDAYWQQQAGRSKEQAQTVETLITEMEGLLPAWKAERTDAAQAQARLEDQALDLKESLRRVSALAPASRVLDGMIRNSETLVSTSGEQEEAVIQLNIRWNDVIHSTQLRDAAIENHIKALAGERDRWSAFYAARIARAQMECSLTGARNNTRKTTSKKGK